MTTPASSSPRPHILDPHDASRHADRLYRAALRLTRSTHEAEDLAQETYAKVLARPRLICDGDDIGYLLRALRNTHVSARRSADRKPCTAVAPESLERVARRGGDPHAAAEGREIVAAIAALPATQRDAVTAVDLLGLSYAEAAAALRVPQGTIMSRLHRARAVLTRPDHPVAVGAAA